MGLGKLGDPSLHVWGQREEHGGLEDLGVEEEVLQVVIEGGGLDGAEVPFQD